MGPLDHLTPPPPIEPAGTVEGLVSIIIPTHNRRELLAETFASARAQTYPDIEIIVIDDGSTDGTLAWLQAQSRAIRPGALQVHPHPRRGVSVARNHGLRAAQGEYVLFLDSDDLLEPDAVAALLAALREKNADYVHAPLRRVNRMLQPLPRPLFMAGPARFDFQWGTHGALYRRNIFVEAGGFQPELRAAEDSEITWRVRSLGRREAFHPQPAGLYRQHDDDHLDSYPTDLQRYRNYWRAMQLYLNWLVHSRHDSPAARHLAGRHCMFIVARLAEAGDGATVREVSRTIAWLGSERWGLAPLFYVLGRLPRPDLAVNVVRALHPSRKVSRT